MKSTTHAFSFSAHYVRAICDGLQFFIRDEFNNKIFGTVIEFAQSDVAYGPIVIYPTGEVAFWGYDLFTLTMVNLGEPPTLQRMDTQRIADVPLAVRIEALRTAHAVVHESYGEDRVRHSWSAVESTHQPQARAPLRLSSPPAATYSVSPPQVRSKP